MSFDVTYASPTGFDKIRGGFAESPAGAEIIDAFRESSRRLVFIGDDSATAVSQTFFFPTRSDVILRVVSLR
jgi:hypothetical protein